MNWPTPPDFEAVCPCAGCAGDAVDGLVTGPWGVEAEEAAGADAAGSGAGAEAAGAAVGAGTEEGAGTDAAGSGAGMAAAGASAEAAAGALAGADAAAAENEFSGVLATGRGTESVTGRLLLA